MIAASANGERFGATGKRLGLACVRSCSKCGRWSRPSGPDRNSSSSRLGVPRRGHPVAQSLRRRGRAVGCLLNTTVLHRTGAFPINLTVADLAQTARPIGRAGRQLRTKARHSPKAERRLHTKGLKPGLVPTRLYLRPSHCHRRSTRHVSKDVEPASDKPRDRTGRQPRHHAALPMSRAIAVRACTSFAGRAPRTRV